MVDLTSKIEEAEAEMRRSLELHSWSPPAAARFVELIGIIALLRTADIQQRAGTGKGEGHGG